MLRAANGWLQGPGGAAWAWMGTRGATFVLFAVLVVWALLARRWKAIVAAALALAITDPLCARVLKPAVGRERPCRALADVATPEGCGAGDSMPSVHAANSAALAAATGLGPLAALAGVVGVSRVVDGQHWPSDVAAGWLIGAAVGAAAARGVERAAERLARARRMGGSTWT